MRFVAKTALLAVILVSMTGCVSIPQKPQVSLVEPSARITKPGPDKALIYFVRTSNFGWPWPAVIFDGDRHIGTLVLEWDKAKNAAKKAYMAYEAAPGQHMFSVYSENADFLPANVSAGKTYFVHVKSVIGTWKYRFYLVPQQGQLPQHELDEVISSGRQLKLTEDGVLFVKENAEDIRKVKADWWQKYQARPANERLELRPEHGR